MSESEKISWARKEELQRQYRNELLFSLSGVRVEVNKMEAFMREPLRWLERVDQAIDRVASYYSLEIPYGIKGPADDARYNPAYRLELLAEKLIERSERGGEKFG